MSAGPHTRDTAEEVGIDEHGDLLRVWGNTIWGLNCCYKVGVSGGGWGSTQYDDGSGGGEGDALMPIRIPCSVRCPLLRIRDSVVELRCCPGTTYALADIEGMD